jgi:hypothetical protein
VSVSQFVFLRDDRLPTVEQWQTALDRAGAGITLDPVGDLRLHRGFLPARHRDHPAGFEWYYGTVARVLGGPPPAGVGDRDYVAQFVTFSDLREAVCAAVAGAVLAQLADGRVHDDGPGGAVGGEEALERVHAMESELS